MIDENVRSRQYPLQPLFARATSGSRGPREASEIEQMLRMQDAAPAARDASMVNWYRQIEPSTR